jgi:hypothetical protein
MNFLDHWLFPKSQFVSFVAIAVLASIFSFLLTGQQIYLANWGLIDDHEIFSFLGPDLRLPPSEIWRNLIASNEGQVFRPSYYLIRLVEASLWGTNVHLWYLQNTICFAIFLSSIWWTMARFVGGWLSGALTAFVALLPLWAGVFSRLGPSEIYGAACVGLMIFAANATLFAASPTTRNAGAVILTLATIILAGMKETFFPLAASPVCVFVFAVATKRLSPLLAGLLTSVILICLGGVIFAIAERALATGTDYYGQSVGPWPIISFAARGLLSALLLTGWMWILPIAALQLLRVVPHKPFRIWVASSRETATIYLFLIAIYAAQWGLYRTTFPTHSRYDFPAMLLVPITACLLACDGFHKMRNAFPERTINYAQLITAFFLIFLLASVYIGNRPALLLAAKKNIEATTNFYSELQRLLQAGKKSPHSPIILDAHGPSAYEPVFSMAIYIRALGTQNSISVRFHPEAKYTDGFLDSLQHRLSELEKAHTDPFVPLLEALSNGRGECLSVGIYGPADVACTAFEIK